YAVRVYEYLAGLPLRRTGPADPSIEDALDVVVSQPAAGSFRFRMRLASPTGQLTLFDPHKTVPADQVSDWFADILQAAGSANGDLEHTVQQPEYRTAFLKLVRAIVPNGKDVNRVELHRLGSRGESFTVLTPDTRQSIDKLI